MSLLFSESPLIGLGTISFIFAGYLLDSKFIICVSIFLLIFLIFFYRYSHKNVGVIQDNIILSPCEGRVLDILDRQEHYYIPIFLSPMNQHGQIYPVNCKVIERKYDKTGEFDMVMNLSKSKNNEKKIHILQMNNRVILSLTQIAGFLPRMITSSDDLTTYNAGDYLGMIKFGSRIDLLIPKLAPDGTQLQLNIKKDSLVNIADVIGEYLPIYENCTCACL